MTAVSTHPDRTTGVTDPLRVVVILGSTREGRAGEPIAEWFLRQGEGRDDLEFDLLDLAEADLPVVLPDSEDVPASVEAVGRRLDAADGFVIVVPEYNHSFPAALKNAIDWFYSEWNAKPVGFVSYGGRAEGIRAVEQLRQVFGELHAVTTRDAVSVNLEHVDRRGHPTLPGCEAAAKVCLDQLAWWAHALREARRAHPYNA
ncbi:NADPH-dependent oxidoreductase [Egibacter rhizosphaerae]|uniref:NADPH-dependent oxidoreductase n=1 Tax=Egibacter rhizosphaerae TaxID=1670831 RepID=A0A411YEQ2_9ACTN|nr:NAD(P)H-dependent oxidoreductase [Egibacter rhizosphaerae]QBI19567.1 NADPH-dependent oxidoreductase [Egibacter rhizosphaerae]